MATYTERATGIVTNILGKAATSRRVTKAVDSVCAVNMMGVDLPDSVDLTDPENKAQFFVESCKSFVKVQIAQHANQVAMDENQAAIDASKDNYIGDFADDTGGTT